VQSGLRPFLSLAVPWQRKAYFVDFEGVWEIDPEPGSQAAAGVLATAKV
jgi:hypothetical protein